MNATARDLALVVLGLPPDRSVAQGDLSLALAGAEVVDLVTAGALSLTGDRFVPGPEVATGDPLLDEAVASLVRREPGETVQQWLWRRGSGLAARYARDLEQAGHLVRPRRRGLAGYAARLAPSDPHAIAGSPATALSPARERAEERGASGEPVLAALLGALGIVAAAADHPSDTAGSGSAGAGDSLPAAADADAVAVETVLAAVGDAVTRLEAIRLRRDVEQAAFDNVWRG
ncbi:GOLPH3/VPS74 family protein [Actinacidiphila acidipaludis]|uniref:GPP34 family phosphoprotein n=1 Tax=Actinacidiphila acidipaludis TaxID=2873382 RepID=A0ABS7QIX3_9ACTN|nr:GPP34 family phosphoprotein [Streptomyces acidipaludis]MBY8882918.1 GPP34 family phosphoprotein [Streptomyces acidipaludis]